MTIPLLSDTYVDLVKRVALGLSVEDAEAVARGLRAIRPHERFRTHILGSAWLCYFVMWSWFNAPIWWARFMAQSEGQRVYDYELALQAGVRALNIWKVCRRNVGIIVAFPKKRGPLVDRSQPPPEAWSWANIAAVAAIVLLFAVAFPHASSGSVLPAAFTNFYVDQGTGASDLNAGTTSDNASGSSAPLVTYAGGTFVQATGVFTVASGNPVTDGVTVGMYASAYTTSGATGATFVAQVTARTTTTVTIDVTTLKWGVVTTVSQTAAASTLKVGGAWTSEIPFSTLGSFTVPTSTKVNIKQATYTITASRTNNIGGSTTAIPWFAGYHTTPADLDNDATNALSRPVFAQNSTFNYTMGVVNHQLWSGIDFTGVRSGTIMTASGTNLRMHRCTFENTSSNAAAVALSNTTAVNIFTYCWAKCPTTATTTGTVSATNAPRFVGCVARGGGLATYNFTTGTIAMIDCISIQATGAGILLTSGVLLAHALTIYGATVDCVKWTSTLSTCSFITSSLFSGLNSSTATTNGLNSSSATSPNLYRAWNLFYNVTNRELGMGDNPEFNGLSDANPVVASATDMTPGSSSQAINQASIFENETFSSYQVIGSTEPQITAGGGTTIAGTPMLRGMVH